MDQSEQINELMSALSKTQANLKGALKDSSNPFFKSNYADLESVWNACREPLSANGLAVSQTTAFIPGAGTCVVTTLGHTSGQWIRGVLPINPVKADPQSQGSAITYARRYALAAVVGVIQVDDDAEDAMNRPPSKTENYRQGVAPTPPQGNLPTPLASVKVGNTTLPDCACGVGKMMISKRNPNEFYCVSCSAKKPRTA